MNIGFKYASKNRQASRWYDHSESLAGRIAYLDLTPFLLLEVEAAHKGDIRQLWLRCGFPRSYLATNADISFEWQQDFIDAL